MGKLRMKVATRVHVKSLTICEEEKELSETQLEDDSEMEDLRMQEVVLGL